MLYNFSFPFANKKGMWYPAELKVQRGNIYETAIGIMYYGRGWY